MGSRGSKRHRNNNEGPMYSMMPDDMSFMVPNISDKTVTEIMFGMKIGLMPGMVPGMIPGIMPGMVPEMIPRQIPIKMPMMRTISELKPMTQQVSIDPFSPTFLSDTKKNN